MNELHELDLSLSAFVEWLNAAESRVSNLSASVVNTVDDARDVLDACRACSAELSQKRHDLDHLATMAEALRRAEVSSSPHSIAFQLKSRYSLIVTKLAVKLLVCTLGDSCWKNI